MTREEILDESNRQPCEVWTRVMGYFRATKSYNAGKVSEYNERQFYKEEGA
jgi:hypothetical protein